jgi:hypothetical protein
MSLDRLPTHPSADHARLIGITPRALIIGILLIPVMCYWNEYTEIVAAATDLAAMSLPIAVVFAILVLIGINALLKRHAPRYAFTQAELLFIFLMQTVSIGISGIGMVQFLNTSVGNVYHYATTENNWQTKIHPYLTPWLFPDKEVLHDYYYGGGSFWTVRNLLGWMAPILSWSLFIVVLLGVMLCINVIVRRQWMDRERLGFPITALPMEITRNGGPKELFTNRLFLLGFGIPCVLETLASLNFLYPSVPYVPIKPNAPGMDLTPLFTAQPWNAIGYTTLALYPLVIGLTYLLSLEVGFSLWFFYLFTKVQNVMCAVLGYRDPGAGMAVQRMPYLGEQSAGAFIGLALIVLWGMRGHLRDVFRKAFARSAEIEDANEPLSYRAAVLGAVGGFAALTWFGIAIGMTWWVPLVFFALYLLFIITFTRIRAEAGLPWAFGPDMNPHQVMMSGFGVRAFNTPTLTGLATVMWFDLDYRCVAMPHQLEAMKLAQGARMNNRHVARVILLATVIGALASWAAVLTCYYQYGAATAQVNSWRTDMGKVPWNTLRDWMDNPLKADAPRMQAVGVGGLVTAGLVALRARFTWWPFHPVGYAVAGTFTMPWLWFPTLLGWLAKLIVIRYGGMKGFRKGLPFFIGLILGDYVTGSLWAIYGSVTGVTTYRAFPI